MYDKFKSQIVLNLHTNILVLPPQCHLEKLGEGICRICLGTGKVIGGLTAATRKFVRGLKGKIKNFGAKALRLNPFLSLGVATTKGIRDMNVIGG